MLLDASGTCLAQAQQEYPTYYPQPEWAEQNPEDWYEAFCATTRTVLLESGVSSGDIAGVGIVGVTHNTVLLDANDRPLYPSILLFDNRSVTQVAAILARWGDLVWAKTFLKQMALLFRPLGKSWRKLPSISPKNSMPTRRLILASACLRVQRMRPGSMSRLSGGLMVVSSSIRI